MYAIKNSRLGTATNLSPGAVSSARENFLNFAPMSAELASGPPPPDLITDLVAEPSNAIALGLGILTASLILLCCCRRKSTLRCRSCITFDSYSDDVEGALLPPTMSRSNDVEPPATPTRLGGPHVIGSATQWLSLIHI